MSCWGEEDEKIRQGPRVLISRIRKITTEAFVKTKFYLLLAFLVQVDVDRSRCFLPSSGIGEVTISH